MKEGRIIMTKHTTGNRTLGDLFVDGLKSAVEQGATPTGAKTLGEKAGRKALNRAFVAYAGGKEAIDAAAKSVVFSLADESNPLDASDESPIAQ